MKKNYIARIGFIVYIAFTIPFSLTRNLSPYTYASTQILLAEKNNKEYKEYKEYIEKSFEEIKKGNYKYAIEFASKGLPLLLCSLILFIIALFFSFSVLNI